MSAHEDKEAGEPHGNSDVSVTVNYQEKSETHIFKHGAKIADVLLWAIGFFSIDDSLATEMELALEGTKDELAGSKPLASLVHGGSTLALDLIRGDIANGSAW
jgi:hypothetical protein